MTCIVYMPEGHNLESYLCSLVQPVESFLESCSDGEQSDTLSGTNTANKSSEQESRTDFSTTRQSSETSDNSLRRDMRNPTLETLTLSALDSRSRANHSPLPETRKEKTTNEICGLSPLSASESFGQHSLFSKTSLDSCPLGTLAELFKTWPKAGMIFAGEYLAQPSAVRPISESVSGLWPTPSANDWKGSFKDGQRRGQLTDPLMGVIPTGAKLNPAWVDWLIGWPLNWSSLEPLERKYFDDWKQRTQSGAKDIQGDAMFGVWWDDDPSETPYRPQSDEQLYTKRCDSVPEMSHEGSHESGGLGTEQEEELVARTTTVATNRVKRITALGNGQVPLCAAVAFTLLTSNR